IILVYDLSGGYVLKWVLPKPDDESANPGVDHISLSKKVVEGSEDDINQSGVSDMNLDEKIGQMIFSGVDGTELTAENQNMIEQYHVGGVILFGNNIDNTAQTVHFLNDIKAANKD